MKNPALAAFSLLLLSAHALSAREPVSLTVRSLLFEVVENGSLSSQRTSVDIDAACDEKGEVSAEVRIVVFSIYPEIRYVLMAQYCASAAAGSVRNLQMDTSSLTLEMTPFPLAPDRPVRLVCTRDKAGKFQASGVALWTNLFTKEPIKLEWRQVDSITLPYPILSQEKRRPAPSG